MQIEIWSDVVCPFCYLGKRRLEKAMDGFEHRDQIEVVYRSFELDPSASRVVTTSTVESLASKYGMSVAEAERSQRQMEAQAARDGLTFDMTDLRSGNTRDAHRLLHMAKQQGRQAELAERLHRAYFTERRSVFDSASLTEIAVEAGLDRGEVAATLAGDAYDDAVDEDEATAYAFGVRGVPFFVIERKYGISGAQPTETFAAVLEQLWGQVQGETQGSH